METLQQKRKCDFCHKNYKFLIVLNKCGFEICYHHFDSKNGMTQRINCPVCKDHQVSLSECMNASKNVFTIQVKELYERLEELNEKILNYKEMQNYPEQFVYQKHGYLFDQLDKRRIQVKSELNDQVDQFYNQLKDFYKLKLDKYVRYVKNNLNSMDLNQKENLIKMLNQSSDRPIKEQFHYLDSFKEQIKETESKIDKINQIMEQPGELDFVHRPNSIKFNIQSVFGRLKFREKKILSPLNELELKLSFEKHSGSVIAVEELINGDLVSASHDSTIKIWNKDNGECMQTLSGHSDMIKGLKVVNTNILSVSKDRHICVWRTNSENFVKKVQSTESITCLAVLENGDLMTGSIEGFIRTWNIESSNIIDEFGAHDKSVYCILFLTSNMFVSCSADKTIKLWSLGSKNCRKIFDGHTEYVWCLEKVSDKKFLSGSKDAKIFLWNIEKANYEIVFQGHKDIVRYIRMKNDEEFLSCSADGSVIEWDLNSSKQKQSLDLPGKIPINAIFITDENELVIALKDGTLQLWSSNFY